MYRKGGNLSTILKDEVELWRNEKTVEMDELGQYPIVPKKFKDVWVGVIPQTGSLLAGRAAETTLSRTTHKVVARYDGEIKEDMWFMIDNKRYDILYILDPYLNKERLEIFCEVVI